MRDKTTKLQIISVQPMQILIDRIFNSNPLSWKYKSEIYTWNH